MSFKIGASLAGSGVDPCCCDLVCCTDAVKAMLPDMLNLTSESIESTELYRTGCGFNWLSLPMCGMYYVSGGLGPSIIDGVCKWVFNVGIDKQLFVFPGYWWISTDEGCAVQSGSVDCDLWVNWVKDWADGDPRGEYTLLAQGGYCFSGGLNLDAGTIIYGDDACSVPAATVPTIDWTSQCTAPDAVIEIG